MKTNRRSYTVLAVLTGILLAGCAGEPVIPSSSEREEDYEEPVSWNGNTCIFNLDAQDSTGFTWKPAYQSDTLTIDLQTYKVFRKDPAAAGGRGHMHYECTVSGDARLLLKCARSEDEIAWYQAYDIACKDGKIVNITAQEYNIYTEGEELHKDLDSGDLYLFLPAGWVFDDYEENDITGFRMRPEGETEDMFLYHSEEPLVSPVGGDLTEETFRMAEREYVLGRNNRDGRILCIMTPDNVACLFPEADWADAHFTELLIMLDALDYYN